jgi:hypothetical protein
MNNYRGPGIYRHYKGGIYEAAGLAIREESKPIGDENWEGVIKEVVYRPLSSGSVLEDMPEVTYWTRTLENFNEDVGVPDAKGIDMTMARFTFKTGPKDPELDDKLALTRALATAAKILEEVGQPQAARSAQTVVSMHGTTR